MSERTENAERPEVTHNAAAGRFELHVGDAIAVLEYDLDGDRIAMYHTGVPRELEGRGYGAQLARAALEHAKAEKLRVIPQCSFVAAYISRHAEYSSLVDRDVER
jgi:predicted GNAT family acetyltransferase